MKYIKKAILLLSLIFISGCMIPTSKKMNLVSIGMTKAEVITKLGDPSSTRASNGVEFLIYNLAPAEAFIVDENHLPEYFVRIVNGKVDSYGKMGDFDSTKPMPSTLNINVNK